MLHKQDRSQWERAAELCRMAAAVVPLIFLPAHAHAQAQQKAPDRIQAPTKFDPSPDSLETLLNGGAEIVGGSAGTGFTLRKGNTWIMCGLNDVLGGAPKSECYLLN